MNRTPRRVRGLALLAATLLLPVLAHAVPVTFQVRMAQQIALGAFDPGADFVDLAGDFNGWGTDPLTPLADADGDSTYVVTLDGFTAGQAIEFKFRINGLWDGTEEFPGFGSNRVYTVLESGNLVDVWYNDFAPGGGEVEVGELHWWNDAVFYEILVRSFQDSDGDGKRETVSLLENGVVARTERDRNGDGRPDVVTTYKNGEVARTEQDDFCCVCCLNSIFSCFCNSYFGESTR